MSKINTEYWGANVSPGSSSGVTWKGGWSSNSFRNLIAQGKYNPNEAATLDLSVSPWGIGPSAAGRTGVIGVFRNGSVDGATPGRISSIGFLTDKENRNLPFTLAADPATIGTAEGATWMYNRINGGIKVNDENYMCSIAYDDESTGSILAGNSTTNALSNLKVPTYLEYPYVRLIISGFYWMNTVNGNTGYYTFASSTETAAKNNWNSWAPADPENIVITSISVNMIAYGMYSGTPNSWGGTPFAKQFPLIPLKAHKMSELANLWVGGGITEDTKWIPMANFSLGFRTSNYQSIPGYNSVQTGYLSRFIPVEGQRYTNATTPTVNQVWNYGFRAERASSGEYIYGNFSDEKHVFDDITYKMRPILWNLANGIFIEFKEGQTLSNASGQYRVNSMYEVESSSLNWRDTLMEIILHEVSFYGFPFSIKWISGADYVSVFEFGHNNTYLPVFDEHLVTTGNYLNGAPSMELPNASWGNVFDDSMPEYDPTYVPPKPEPEPGGETPWDDNPITRIQEGYWTGFGGITYISSVNDFSWAFEDVKVALQEDLGELRGDLLGALQQYLADKSSANKQTYDASLAVYNGTVQSNTAKFSKGYNTNYTDCLLSMIRYPFDISPYFHRSTTSNQMLWGNTFVPVPDGGLSSDIWLVSGYNTGQIVQGGSLYVEKRYNNFLNYAPYTTAELYIPYCGSVPIDLEVFAGHTIDVKYLIDWFSGSCLALIYRDRVVVDQIPGQIGTSVGIVAEDIQSYQNAMFNGSQTLKAQKNAFRNSFVNGMGQSMDQLSGAIGNVATAALGGEPSSSSSQSGGGAFAGGFSVGTGISQNYQNVKTAKYNLDHTTIDFKQIGSNGPSVGSWNEQVCRLVLYYPTFLPEYSPSEYGHTVGFACLFNKTLSDFSGLTVCSSVDTSGLTDATESEKTLIEDALKSGVYL